ncbi:MAG: hypothetical protein ACTHLO_16190 [Pseudolabrys sp.]
MLKSAVKPMAMVIYAAAIAALATLFSVGGNEVSAGPLGASQAAAIKSCTERPWPYNTCVGTALGKRNVRLITIDRLPAR